VTKGGTKIVLRYRPIERHALARVFLQRRANGGVWMLLASVTVLQFATCGFRHTPHLKWRKLFTER
jgi:hypothetical protein